GVEVRTGRVYEFRGRGLEAGDPGVNLVTRELLVNPVVQHVASPGELVFPLARPYRFSRRLVKLRGLSGHELAELSRQGLWALSRAEMLALQKHFEQLGRDPTDVEVETFAQTWSEHCQHKTFKGTIDLDGRRIRNLLKSTVFRLTEELALPWCLSVFHDNSGVIEFDEQYGVSFKVETHNHPSALEPYGGAATGIGGVIRDCLGTGLGAKPILNTDVFCLAPVDTRPDDVPSGVLHPRRVLKGVVAGVRDYGNRMGIPTANGAVYFDRGFLGNPLVFCGTLGLIPKDKLVKKVRPGQRIVLLGGKTGRDGIHGVTFASLELHHRSDDISGGAVQIGNPIEEKKLADLVLAARDQGLFSAITDCGGGGLSSAIGELAGEHGCEVWLERVPLKYAGLSPAEIWVSEAQERMVVFAEPESTKKLLSLAGAEDVEATVIGRVTDSGRLLLKFRRRQVADIEMDFLHRGWRGVTKRAHWQRPETADPSVPTKLDLTGELLRLLQAPNIASKEWVVRQYDHEVQARSGMKPFCGRSGRGPTDACVVMPVRGSARGCVVACGLCPRYGLIDPYWMAGSAIDEALRNCVAAGADISRIALLDNFCWGSPDRPDQLAGLVRAAQACYEIGGKYRVPFISGKDSLYNEFKSESGVSVPIPPTLLISAVGVIPDATLTATPDFKTPGSLIYLLGQTREELGGSEYFRRHQGLGREVPKVEAAVGRRTMVAVGAAVRRRLLVACHDLSDGGLGVALAEMCIAGGVGAGVSLRRAPGSQRFRRDDFLLFSESNGRFLCEVPTRNRRAFEELLARLRVPASAIGRTTGENELRVKGLRGNSVVKLNLSEAETAWRRALTRRL
ncbi:phosphoribosylformylglycinamidine synthase subunit PurL, partial [candidate division WOR-3 bacterium]|nr:phosphoribosylformylglycinamidine synthase subunit PurL [candidate division WOR-3 bacterium]